MTQIPLDLSSGFTDSWIMSNIYLAVEMACQLEAGGVCGQGGGVGRGGEREVHNFETLFIVKRERHQTH